MTTTPDNTATTWRDLADQLTPEQVASYEQTEQYFRSQGIPGAISTTALLEYARGDIGGNLADAAYGDVPAPPGSISVDKWMDHTDFGLARGVVWREFSNGDLSVDIDGWQQCDGTAVPQISLYLDEGQKLTSSQARALAVLLVQAADELNRLTLPE
ncbi:hypothetical protein KQR54_05650 [Mycobacterium gordonae]|uniref:hypothetical protein n=1 Tax=Mycobacterium gordonae TaxID=1778 RepID=UPI002108A40C|nr:hypothetical protein [Mycobacterium gordonae]MCQ4360631.1 hypothetical protein [Mycobacterium gordonae]